MSYYIILHILLVISLLIFWFYVFERYIKQSGIFFLKFSILSAIRFSIYIIMFTPIYDKSLILFLSRLMYWLSIGAFYNMLFFVWFFNINIKKSRKYLILLDFIWLWLMYLSLFTDTIIKNMSLTIEPWRYLEVYWNLYFIFEFLYLFFLPLFIFIWFRKMKYLYFLNKVRVKYLLYWFIIFTFLGLLFQVILPLFWIYLFEKEVIFFLLPFILSIFYASHRYKFIDMKFFARKILNFILSSFLSIFFINIFRYYFLNYLDIRLVWFWWISQDFWFSDLFFGIILYLVFYTIFKKYIFWNNEYVELTKRIWKLKKKILFLSNFYSLNSFLNKEFASLIKTKYVNISLYDEKNNNLEWLKKYFEKDSSYNLFINDTVFIEENKHKFDADKIAKEISEKSYLIFPLMNNTWDFLWVFEVWTKSFKDIYTSEEIDIIAEFAEFLILQLKHIEIYSQIQDMNINLDKKIDEKTIEYNNLLNKQTDFIAMISHEIKSPLGSCIFQIDSIIDDIKSWNQDKKYLLKELEILNTQLLNVWDLTKTMFSIKKFDLNKVELFKQKVDINVFLNEKVQNHKKENIEFILDITDDLHYINIDKIQFWQVIDNLIVNAIKFTNKETPKIYIKAKLEENNLIFEIEDNGEWFEWVDAENIFDKYTTGKISDVWIWMWMYLCKKIVELHGWNIKAWNGEYLPWASFKIVIPNIID